MQDEWPSIKFGACGKSLLAQIIGLFSFSTKVWFTLAACIDIIRCSTSAHCTLVLYLNTHEKKLIENYYFEVCSFASAFQIFFALILIQSYFENVYPAFISISSLSSAIIDKFALFFLHYRRNAFIICTRYSTFELHWYRADFACEITDKAPHYVQIIY